MKTLNNIYIKSCKSNYKKYEKLSNNIILIDNFFENFENARNFFITRDKWQSSPHQRHSKPGGETLLPSWTGKLLMEKFILDNKLIDDQNSYQTCCNFFYEDQTPRWSITNSTYFPHIDSYINDDYILTHICLVNLNKIPVSTKFYSYKNQEYCNDTHEWGKYTRKVETNLINFYNKEHITSEEIFFFLKEQKNFDVKEVRQLEYNPNQAIIYPAKLFHSPNLNQEKKFTENDPRVLLRISFDLKNIKIKNNKKNINYA